MFGRYSWGLFSGCAMNFSPFSNTLMSLVQSVLCYCFIILTSSTFSRLLLDATKERYILLIFQVAIFIGLSKLLVRYGWPNAQALWFFMFLYMWSWNPLFVWWLKNSLYEGEVSASSRHSKPTDMVIFFIPSNYFLQ